MMAELVVACQLVPRSAENGPASICGSTTSRAPRHPKILFLEKNYAFPGDLRPNDHDAGRVLFEVRCRGPRKPAANQWGISEPRIPTNGGGGRHAAL